MPEKPDKKTSPSSDEGNRLKTEVQALEAMLKKRKKKGKNPKSKKKKKEKNNDCDL